MPCRDYGENERIRYEPSPEDQQRLDNYAQMLCALCEFVEESGIGAFPNEQVKKWWKQHKAADKRTRAIQEKIRRDKEKLYLTKLTAWKKLSPQEREALGLSKPSHLEPPDESDDI